LVKLSICGPFILNQLKTYFSGSYKAFILYFYF